MQKGEIWQLDASIVHAATNFHTDTRVQICLDFQFSEAVPPDESIYLDPNTAKDLAKLTIPVRQNFDNLDMKLDELAKSINNNNRYEALVDLSRLHLKGSFFFLPLRDVYQVIQSNAISLTLVSFEALWHKLCLIQGLLAVKSDQ